MLPRKFLIAPFLVLAACNRPDDASVTPLPTAQSGDVINGPACIQQKIQTFLAEPVRNPAARILRFQYNGDTVFYIPDQCCDQYSDLYDKHCNLICHPDGGFSGGGDGQCPTFWSTATDSAEIWRDPR